MPSICGEISAECEHSVYKVRPETIRCTTVSIVPSNAGCGGVMSLPDFVAPVALMFSSDKVTVVGKGNGGLHPTCAHVRRPWAQPPRGLAGAVGLNCEDQRGA